MNGYLPVIDKPKSTRRRVTKQPRTNLGVTFYIFILLIAAMFFAFMYINSPTKQPRINGGEYAALLLNTVDGMDLPYEIKHNLMQIIDADELLREVNKSLGRSNKILSDKNITREQCAYMTDFFFRYISVNYEPATDTLTHLPDFISKSIFEREILNKITDKTDKATVRAYSIF
jgi:hypothetical protein